MTTDPMAPWLRVKSEVLNQGDLLRDIAVPSVQSSFPDHDENGNVPLNVGQANIIVLSQSCDLEQKKVSTVVAAQTFTWMNSKGQSRLQNEGKVD